MKIIVKKIVHSYVIIEMNRIDEKINKRVEKMFQDSEYSMSKIKLDKQISSKLLSYQYLHVYSLIDSLQKHRIILDSSDTGTGKTYCAIAVAKHLNCNVIIICPKTIISTWKKVCEYFGITALLIINYEKIRTGCDYVTKGDDDDYTWTVPSNTLIIFDEVHRCKNMSTLNGKLLSSLKYCKIMVLLLSATLSDTSKSFRIFGYLLGLYDLQKFNGWIKKVTIQNRNSLSKVNILNGILFPEYGSQIKIADIRDEFPDNQVDVICYDLDKSKLEAFNKEYKCIENHLSDLDNKINLSEQTLEKLMYYRQKIELIKSSIIIELTKEYVDNNYSVAIFVNFNKTVELLQDKLGSKCIVVGSQSVKERDVNIDNFQTNKESIIICNIKSGGESISLHDLHGRPRVSIISPSFSSIELIQSLGRIYRSGALSPALQRIIFCANTCEESICQRIKDKLDFITQITDDDLLP